MSLRIRNIAKNKLSAVLLGLLLSTPLFAAEHANIDACGHEDHDSLEARHQAGTRTYWQDDHAANPKEWIRFKVLGFNDFHGNLERRTLFGRPVGGAAVLASYLQAESNESKNGAIIVHAGDHVGASPPVSALLQDEPSITFLNMLTNKACRDIDDDKTHQHRKGDDHEDDARFDPRCNLVGA